MVPSGFRRISIRIMAETPLPSRVSAPDLLDDHFRVRLAMALLLAVVLLGLVFEDDDFPALAVLLHPGRHAGALHDGRAGLEAVIPGDGEHAVEGDRLAFFGRQLLDVEHVAFLHAVLLAAGFDDCVHVACTSPCIRLAGIRVAPASIRRAWTKPVSSGC